MMAICQRPDIGSIFVSKSFLYLSSQAHRGGLSNGLYHLRPQLMSPVRKVVELMEFLKLMQDKPKGYHIMVKKQTNKQTW